MGIFSRTPKIPEPIVTRQLDSDINISFHPGSQVSGAISITSPVQRNVRLALAAFYGHCETHSTRSESSGAGPNQTSHTVHYHDDVELFRFEHRLGEGFTAMAEQTFSFPFMFTVPSQSINTRGEVYRNHTATSEAYDTQPHDLPPSFAWEGSTYTYARVEYHVEAVIFFDDQPEPHIVKFTPLDFAPLPPHISPNFQPPFVEFVKPGEKYASSRLIGEAKSFRSSIRDKFSSGTPSVDVTMKASLTPILHTGTAFPVYVCIELANLSDATTINIPVMSVKITSLKLYRYTMFRTLRARGRMHPENETVRDDSIYLNAVPEARVVEQQLGPEKRQLIFPATFEARIPSDMCPSFRTVTINHSFRLKAVVEVEIAGKGFEHKFEAEELAVWPAAERRADQVPAYDTGVTPAAGKKNGFDSSGLMPGSAVQPRPGGESNVGPRKH